ncbi:MAG: hypothetical protein AAB728_03800 [Patescibacteria group bacterium]
MDTFPTLIARTLEHVRRHWRTFLGGVLLFGVLWALITHISQNVGFRVAGTLNTIVWLCTYYFFFIQTAFEEESIRALLQKSIRYLLPSICLWAWIFVRSFAWLPILPVYFLPFFLAAPVIMVREGTGVLRSAQLSTERSKGHWLGIMSSMALLLVASLVGIILVFSILSLFQLEVLLLLFLQPFIITVVIAIQAVFQTKLSLSLSPGDERGLSQTPATSPGASVAVAGEGQLPALPKDHGQRSTPSSLRWSFFGTLYGGVWGVLFVAISIFVQNEAVAVIYGVFFLPMGLTLGSMVFGFAFGAARRWRTRFLIFLVSIPLFFTPFLPGYYSQVRASQWLHSIPLPADAQDIEEKKFGLHMKSKMTAEDFYRKTLQKEGWRSCPQLVPTRADPANYFVGRKRDMVLTVRSAGKDDSFIMSAQSVGKNNICR